MFLLLMVRKLSRLDASKWLGDAGGVGVGVSEYALT